LSLNTSHSIIISFWIFSCSSRTSLTAFSFTKKTADFHRGSLFWRSRVLGIHLHSNEIDDWASTSSLSNPATHTRTQTEAQPF
jgi:hypothetical protein